MKNFILFFLLTASMNAQSLDNCVWNGTEIACKNQHTGYTFDTDDNYVYDIMLAVDSAGYVKSTMVIVDDRNYPEDNLELYDGPDMIGYIEPVGGLYVFRYFYNPE